MLALHVDLRTRPEMRDAFVAAVKLQAETSLEAELGCLRFDVCEDVDDADHFLVYEVYEDEEALAAHRLTEHFARWAGVRNEAVIEQRRTLTRIL
jgi:quinol monooxygenase YgiN